jgi:plastocyanin
MRRWIRLSQRIGIGVLIAAACSTADCSSGSSSSSTPTAPSSGSGDGSQNNPITVFITNSTYSPNPLTVKAGQYVNFKNNDGTVHSATFDNGTYESGDIPAYSAHDVAVAMTTTGTVTFHCRFHGENGSIVVTQ